MDPRGSTNDREGALLMRLVEELTNRPVSSVPDALEKLYQHFLRYRRAQTALNDSAGFGLADPTHLDLFDACILVSERYSALTRSIQALESTRHTFVRQDYRVE
jgi:hypothetical protein